MIPLSLLSKYAKLSPQQSIYGTQKHHAGTQHARLFYYPVRADP
jgi:hypothetical protein